MPLLPSHTLLQTYSITLLLTSYLLLSRPLTLLNATPLWLLGEAMHILPASFIPKSNPPTTHTPHSTLIHASLPPVLPKPTTELLAVISLVLLLAALTQSVLCTPLRYSHSDLTHLAQKSLSRPTLNGQRTLDREAEDSRSAFAEKLYNLHTTQTLFLTLSALRVLSEGALVALIYLFYSTRSSTSATADLETEISSTGIFTLLANRVVFSVTMADMLFWGYLWTVLRDEARDVAGLVGKRRKMEEELEE